ncbi:MAG: glutamate/tyrosine decarboxylase-like PLP-dependent enzyme [Phycisphaerales bacterium]|jgi:glutamate/tyrosine decarboxylase-like PLP-dependent enzyme
MGYTEKITRGGTEAGRMIREGAQRGAAYLAGVGDRPVAASAEAVAGLSELDEAMPGGPSEPGETLGMLDRVGSPATTATAGPRYFGFVIGGQVPAAAGAGVLVSVWDQNAGMQAGSPIGSKTEEVAGRWMLELLGLDPACAVGFATGATMANFTALCAARHWVCANAGWDVEGQGLMGGPAIRVVAGEQVHISVRKSVSLAGLGRDRIELVKADEQGRMIPGELPELDERTILLLQAGDVNSGTFDFYEEIIPRAKAAGAWVHVDGAFGLWAGACEQTRHLVRGVEGADSWATDCHKWLNVGYDSGVVICRDTEALLASMSARASYLVEGDRRDPSWFVPELSRRARGVEVWAALRSLGVSGVDDLIARCCRHARRFAAGLGEAGFEIINESDEEGVVLNQVLVSFGDDETTKRAIGLIQEDGTCWVGGTDWTGGLRPGEQGRHAMRISVTSWATTDEDVERSLAAMIRCGRAAVG